MARLECDFRIPVALSDDALDVGLTVEKVGRTSIQATYRLRRTEDAAEAAITRQVLVLMENGAPRPAGDVERTWLLQCGSDA
ncbi:acyl-CoA thioesterase [Dactylosporangium sp. NPDC000521]|uniref:acyl-CoA thioesterase n=1 Tax=Dactylosporangium sp. NPDC000521 TaxID=3363975 RepID=UPI0036850E17